MSELKQILMRRDGLTAAEADAAIEEASEDFYSRIREGDITAEDVLLEHFGLEPDYILDII